MIQAEETRDGVLPIAPPSQIGLDVLRPPALPEIAAARAELARRPNAATAKFTVGDTGDAKTSSGTPKSASPESFKRFEAMVLQSFIQNMLPKDGAAVYGKGMAGEMWKSMMAENLAKVMADRGGIGIADRMLGEHYTAETKPEADTAMASQAATPASMTEPESELVIAPAVLDGMQRALSSLLVDDAASETATQSTTKRG